MKTKPAESVLVTAPSDHEGWCRGCVELKAEIGELKTKLDEFKADQRSKLNAALVRQTAINIETDIKRICLTLAPDIYPPDYYYRKKIDLVKLSQQHLYVIVDALEEAGKLDELLRVLKVSNCQRLFIALKGMKSAFNAIAHPISDVDGSSVGAHECSVLVDSCQG